MPPFVPPNILDAYGGKRLKSERQMRSLTHPQISLGNKITVLQQGANGRHLGEISHGF